MIATRWAAAALAPIGVWALSACVASEPTPGNDPQPSPPDDPAPATGGADPAEGSDEDRPSPSDDPRHVPDGTDPDDGPQGSDAFDQSGVTFTHKMMKPTGENLFASLAYECPQCSFEQYLAIDPPPGWTKGPPQVAVHSSGELRSTPSLEGVPESMDFVPEIPGPEYTLIAKNLDGVIIERGPRGVIVQAQVMRDTLLRFSAGGRVHELTDPEGNVFVLFAHGVDPVEPVIPDFDDADVLGDFSGPQGWTYTTRVLDEPLLLDTSDIATVLAIRKETTSTWEMR